MTSNHWKEALQRLRSLDASWQDEALRLDQIIACREWIENQRELPRLAALARLLTPSMTRQQFWSVLVPVEREVAQVKITDIDILDSDLPDTDASPAHPPMPLTIVLDSIRSAFNVGGIFRSAECFGVQEVGFVVIRPCLSNRRLQKPHWARNNAFRGDTQKIY
jgi:23S rRNA (guanosine2251-2'-O)-methyltransferase